MVKQKLGLIWLCKRIHKNEKYFYDVKLKKDWIQNYELNNILNLSIEDAYISINNNSIYIKEKISIGLSTGTSGASTPFISTEMDRLNWFFAIFIRLFPISYFRPIKISFFLKYNNNLYTDTSKNSFINIKYFDANIDIKDNIDSLLNFDPEVIVAPAQTLKKILNTNLNFTNLKKFISVTEKLDYIDKNNFKNINLKEIYQATEGFLGVSCNYGKLHLNEDILIIEKYSYYFNGIKYFFPVITDFKREAQIVTRLFLDDLLEECSIKCLCKNNFISIESVDSRLNDIVVSYYQNSFHFIPSNFLNKIMIKYLDYENDFNILQIKLNLFAISTSRDILLKNKFYIKEEIQKLLNLEIKIQWKIISKNKKTFHKKRRIRSLIKKEIKILNKIENFENSIKLISENSSILMQNKNFNNLPDCIIIIHT